MKSFNTFTYENSNYINEFYSLLFLMDKVLNKLNSKQKKEFYSIYNELPDGSLSHVKFKPNMDFDELMGIVKKARDK